MEYVPDQLLAQIAALSAVWFLLPDHYRELCARRIVVCVGLWHLSQSNANSNNGKLLTHSNSNNDNKRVSFGQLEILEFPTLLGDNPSVRQGAPLTLDWKPVHRSIKQVDLVPDKRGPYRKPKALSATERELLLLAKGYTLLEIERAAAISNKQHSSTTTAATPFGSLKNKVRSLVHRRAAAQAG